MPLQAGKSAASFAANIRELMHAFHATGKIGSSKPASKAKANKQAVAIAYAQKRRTIAHGGK
jgi:hypothetical protein